MKKLLYFFSLLIFFSLGSTYEANAQIIVIKIPKPPTIVITRPSTPKAGHVWVEGHWYADKKSNKHQWKKGHWKQSNDGHYWSAGKWESCEGGHHWVSGKWVKGNKGHHHHDHGKHKGHDKGKHKGHDKHHGKGKHKH